MADGYVQVQPDSTGKKVDTAEVVVNGQTVERQRMALASPTDPIGAAEVDTAATGPLGDGAYGLLVRELREENALNQMLMTQIADVLSLVLARTTASAASLVVSQPTSGNLNATVAQATAANLNATVNISALNGSGVSATQQTQAWGATSFPVSLNPAFPLPGVPQHIYGGISV